MRYLFVVAHPDDEVLGAGAFINRLLKDESNEVDVIILNADYEKTRREMFEDIEKSHDVLGIKKRCLFSFKNMDFINEKQRDMVEAIEAEIKEFKPDYVFTHFDGDVHNDHRVTNAVTKQAARLWQRHASDERIKGLYEFEVLSSTNWNDKCFKPDTYVDVSEEDLDAKVRSLEMYQNVVRPMPHPRSKESVNALAILRGSEIGCNYAEAFKTVWRYEV